MIQPQLDFMPCEQQVNAYSYIQLHLSITSKILDFMLNWRRNCESGASGWMKATKEGSQFFWLHSLKDLPDCS